MVYVGLKRERVVKVCECIDIVGRCERDRGHVISGIILASS